MKIYFENGTLTDSEFLPFTPDCYCNAKYGYVHNVGMLNYMQELDDNAIVYTNSLVALSGIYSWNKELQDFDVFMREDKNSKFKRISELYGGKLRCSQNIEAMFKSGCFGCL